MHVRIVPYYGNKGVNIPPSKIGERNCLNMTKTIPKFLICQRKQHPLTRAGQKSDDGGQRVKGALRLRLKAKELADSSPVKYARLVESSVGGSA